MKKFQTLIYDLCSRGERYTDPEGKTGLSLPTYTLEYQFEMVNKRKIHARPFEDGFPIIAEFPKKRISEMISKINQLPLKEFEEYNRTINNFVTTKHHVGDFKNGKSIKLPFLKEADDITAPICKITEPLGENSRVNTLNLEVTIYNKEIICDLPKCLDMVTIFFCVLCITSGYNPNKITFNLVRAHCEDIHLKALVDMFFHNGVHYKDMKIKPSLTNLLNLKTRDVELTK